MRAWLRDDNRCTGGDVPAGLNVGLDDDWSCSTGTLRGDAPIVPDAPPGPVDSGEPASPYWSCTVMRRARIGYDDDGVPLFDWRAVVTGPAILRVERKEEGAVAGISSETGTVTLAYDGAADVFETAIVKRSDLALYRVTAVARSASTLRLDVTRIRQEPDAPAFEDGVLGGRVEVGSGPPPTNRAPGSLYLDEITGYLYGTETEE